MQMIYKKTNYLFLSFIMFLNFHKQFSAKQSNGNVTYRTRFIHICGYLKVERLNMFVFEFANV